MRLTNHSAIALLALVGCVDASDSTHTLRIEPAYLQATIVNGQPVMQDYRAIEIDSDGTEHDVTAQARFSLAAGQFGLWHFDAAETSLELRGAAVGPTTVFATYDGLSAQAALTVYATTSIYNENVPPSAAAMFDRARAELSCAPAIVYPGAGSLLPKNLDGLDVHWTDARDDLFAISLTTEYATVDVYSRSGTPSYATVPADAWQQLASTGEPVSLRMRGMASDTPEIACTSYPMRLFATNTPMSGAMYYWADGLGIWRHDVSERGEAEPMAAGFTATTSVPVLATALPGSCQGCAVSRDGSRLALRLDSGGNAVIDFTSDQMMMQSTSMQWDWATFTSSSDELIVSNNGQMQLIDLNGQLISDIPTTLGADGYDPQLSPSGTMLANVEFTGYSPTLGAAIVVRSFGEDGSRFGKRQILVPGGDGVANYFPSWSPDGQWLAYTRGTGWGTASPTASIWVVKADGSQPPIQLVAPAADIEMAARWAPGEQSNDGSRFWYVTFDSRRPFGTRTTDTRQMWAMPFFPELGIARPAFHLPFQSTEMDNHVAQWATALVR